MSLTESWVGIAAILIFVAGYGLVVAEEFTSLRKSKPMVLAAGVIWSLIAYQYVAAGQPHAVEHAVSEFLVEFSELFLFLLVAMTYVNAMSERNVFDALRSWLVSRQLSYRALFWITGLLSFVLSPLIDNLTTALVMSAVVLAVGRENARFVSVSCINIVVAANAGGAAGVLAFRRHHHVDGLAGRDPGVYGVLPSVCAVTGQLRPAGCSNVPRDRR